MTEFPEMYPSVKTSKPRECQNEALAEILATSLPESLIVYPDVKTRTPRECQNEALAEILATSLPELPESLTLFTQKSRQANLNFSRATTRIAHKKGWDPGPEKASSYVQSLVVADKKCRLPQLQGLHIRKG